MLSYKVILLALLSSSALAAPLSVRPLPRYTLAGREVPQEHAHEDILRSVGTTLNLNNPDEIVDSVFSLLGNAAAIQGAGLIADANCLQQAIADQAFTNAKEAGDIDAMVDALIFRTLERNSGSVGATTTPCATIDAVNPEIAALQQHQDPASDNAAAVNKDIALTLAVQIASIGGDPQRALESGTFPPGDLDDPTGAGNTCDDADDANGCINTLGLLVPDATADEIDEAVAAAGGAVNNGAANDNNNNNNGAADVDACVVNAEADDEVDDAEVDNEVVNGAAAAAAAGDIGDFGDCSVPEVEFGVGFDNRKETSFQPVDAASFSQGSAQAFGIIGTFICDQLVNSCGADQTAIDTCDIAKAAADAEAPKTGAQADAFNAVFGITSNFAAVQPVDDQGRDVVARSVRSFRRPRGGNRGASRVAANCAQGAAADNTANNAADNTANNAADNTADNNAADNTANAAGGNLQTFNGDIGGPAPAVTASGRGFAVAGSDDFLNVNAALGRSCDIQKNACANVANSGNADLSVSDCDAQNALCRGLI